MVRVFLLLIFVLLNLQASSCRGGYTSCKQKIIDSKSIINQSLQFPVKKHQRILFSTSIVHAKILKYDPYLSLYLIEDKEGFKYPFKINYNLTLGTAGVDKKMAIEGKILKRQVGLNSFAKYSEPLFVPSLLLTSCCSLEGIVTSKGIIEKEYIDRFVNVKKVSYADIGIRVEDKNKDIVVNAINPYMKGNPFKLGDFILEFDGKKVKTSAVLMRKILFSKIGSIHKVKVKRGRKVLTLKVKGKKRYGGGYLSDTFLEFLGLSFDKNLYIVKIEKKAEKYGLKLGDRLLQINQTDIFNEEDIIKTILQTKNSSNLLLQRDGFQFFVNVN
ncbi:MAG: PDZ domain-containing protein [Campylobacterota bacterium]|nr:PDZ domain-containing protein [Campylobacterota bacterium]